MLIVTILCCLLAKTLFESFRHEFTNTLSSCKGLKDTNIIYTNYLNLFENQQQSKKFSAESNLCAGDLILAIVISLTNQSPRMYPCKTPKVPQM